MEYGRQTVLHYENTAREFARKNGHALAPAKNLLEMFRASLPGNRVLEIGFGLGADAGWFTDNGFDYTGVEPAKIYHDLLEEGPLSLSVIRKDIRRVSFKEESFDGIWAKDTFLHFNDEDFAGVAQKCRKWLRPTGVLFFSVKEGAGEEVLPDGRYFNYFTNEKARLLVPAQMPLAGFFRTFPTATHTSARPILNYYFRK